MNKGYSESPDTVLLSTQYCRADIIAHSKHSKIGALVASRRLSTVKGSSLLIIKAQVTAVKTYAKTFIDSLYVNFGLNITSFTQNDSEVTV